MSIVNFTYPKFQSIDPVTGNPRVGYKLFTYAEGTSTKKTTWTDITKVGANTNPIILDSNGEASIWLDGNYKFVLAAPTDTDPPTSPVWTVDNIRSPLDPIAQQVTLHSPINGSFETDTNADGVPNDWDLAPYTGGTVLIDSSTAIHGANSLKFSSVGSGGGVASTTEYYETEGGYPVKVSFDLISANANTRNKVQLYWYNASKIFLSSSDAYNNGVSNPTSWTRKEALLTAPASARYYKIVVTGVDPSSTTHSTTNVDNFVTEAYKLRGVTSITPSSDADYTLSSTDVLADIIIFNTGSWTTARNIIVPNDARSWASIINSSAYNLTVKTAAGTGITIAAGYSSSAVCDGTNVRATTTSAPNLPSAGDAEGVTTTGSITSGTAILSIASGAGISNNMWVVGYGIPLGTYVVSGGGGTVLTLSANATVTLSNAAVCFFDNTKNISSATSAIMRAGLPDQRFVDVTASRAGSTDYVNNTFKPIEVQVKAITDPSLTGFAYSITPTIDGVTIPSGLRWAIVGSLGVTASFTVPVGSTYSVAFNNCSKDKWVELR